MSDYENDELQEVGDEELLQTEFDDSDVEEPNVDDSDEEEPNVDDSDEEESNEEEPNEPDEEEPNEEEPNEPDEEEPNEPDDSDEEPNVDDPEIDDLNEEDENEGLINEKLGVEKEFEITKEDLEQQDEESEEEPEEDEEYTIDDFEEDNLQKINDNLKKNMILENHPESLNHNIMEIKALSNVIRDKDGRIMDDLHKTNPFITKYEKTRILGLRAKQINSGSKPFVNVPLNIIDGYTIANMEYKEKKIPFIIRRPIPNGGSEYWKVKDLEQLI